MQQETYSGYRIIILGHLDQSWSEWFDNFAITYPDDATTVLKGVVQDQAQLHAVLLKIRDLNLKLVSINPT